MSEYVANEPTVPLSLWQSLNREFEQTAKALSRLSFEHEKYKREMENRLANMQYYKERCESIDMGGT